MTDQQDLSLGEIQRSLVRIEANQAKFAEALQPIIGLQIRVDGHDDEIRDLREDMKAVTGKAATVAGGISVLAFLGSLLPWHK
jgi:hypothetical protein